MRLPEPRALAAAILLGGVLCWSEPASAILIGNPAPVAKKNDVSLGLALSDFRETLRLDWNLTDSGALLGLLGRLETNAVGGSAGTEIGAGYRHTLDVKFNIGKFPARMGIVGIYRSGRTKVQAQTFDASVLHVAVGGFISPLERLNTYAAGVFERTRTEQDATNRGNAARAESGPGAALGAEYWLTPSLVGGIEAHANLVDSELTLFGAFRF